ncbi:hypothetical protein Hdeb2414_s0013g00404811 [Helianthus debilis subsp. tardiflorus]
MFVFSHDFVMLSLMLLCFAVGYSLLKFLDPKAAGFMVEAILPEGKPVRLDQIRDRFLHDTSDIFAAYANIILGEDDGDDLDDAADPTREEIIVLSSEGSDRSREGLIPRSQRAGPTQGVVNEPINEPAGDDVDVPSDAAEQLEARQKKKVDRSEKKKKVEEPVAKATRKQPSNFSLLDYVVVSDMLSSLDAGDKRVERDPDNDVTLTEIMKKKKVLEDKKKELDEQATAALATKKSKLQKETHPAPSESEVVEGGAADAGDDACGAGGNAGGAGGDGRGEDVDTEAESSEATLRHTIYTKRPPGSGGGDTSGVRQSPEYENVQTGSWDTHNPACADFPHAPRWNLVQGSRMTDLNNCREVADAEEKLAKEKQFNANKQKEWETACEQTNRELQTQRDAIIRLSWEKTKISDEAEQERVASQKREHEYIQRIAKLEKFAEEKVAEVKASEILVEEVTVDCRWLLPRAVPLISERIAGSEELAKYICELGEAAYDHGRKDGYAERRAAAENKEALKNFDLYKVDCVARYAEKRQEFESLKFAIVKAAGKLSRKSDGIAWLKRALGDEDPEGGDAGPSRQD